MIHNQILHLFSVKKEKTSSGLCNSNQEAVFPGKIKGGSASSIYCGGKKNGWGEKGYFLWWLHLRIGQSNLDIPAVAANSNLTKPQLALNHQDYRTVYKVLCHMPFQSTVIADTTPTTGMAEKLFFSTASPFLQNILGPLLFQLH